jgi:hypothetical protein
MRLPLRRHRSMLRANARDDLILDTVDGPSRGDGGELALVGGGNSGRLY